MAFTRNTGYQAEVVLGSEVADDGTVTVAYPTGSSQATFLYGGEKYGSSYVVLNDNDKLTQGHPSVEFTYGASNITVTNRSGAAWAAGTKVRCWFATWAPSFRQIVTVPVTLDTVADGDVVTSLPLGVAGYITHLAWVTDTAPSSSDATTFNLEIGTTNVTGGSLELTSAAAGARGTVVHATQITANNRLEKTSLLSIEASATTDYASGNGYLMIFIQPDLDGD